MPEEVVETKDAGTSTGSETPSLSTTPTPDSPPEVSGSQESAKAAPEVSDGAPAEVNPEAITLKTGKDSPFEDADVKGLTEFATENKLDQKTADAMLQYNEKMVGQFAARAQERAERQVDAWIDTASKDEEIGGTKFEESKQLAYKVNQRFGTPELRAFLDEGAGNHPEIFRLFVRIGRAMQDDTRESGMPVIPKKEVPLAQKLYGGTSG